ncbi:pheromone-regulated membrane protein [Histoplasma capsulatum var. duboisii H88]|uniref:Pheromone-regulated membrane protein n=1 Tax=Ajellomyces capsulatus (strain H88) TaxID=544711 RepID=F0UUA1_AJEC8|nr:pheromone-regulated membrane protein [Histoplasma capsulatum var. duboisii H88]QSS57689.1 pheromone-regulated membrane protein [Histoplasma capsulatum var. duboisii H88]
MGCCTGRKEEYWGHMRAEQKWEYINLQDFKSKTCFAQFSYFILWISVFISTAVYGVDSFTAVNLIAFNRWSTEAQQLIPRYISKWIFAGCIMLSFVFLIYRWIRAVRVLRQGGVAQSYLDPLAARVQSIRIGEKGQGWRRFLVFYELTKSKKGADYVALFTYFNFESWMRTVFAEGPRQFINGTILYSVMESDLILQGKHAAPEGTSPISQFFSNVGALAEKDKRQAVILSAMLFTLLIWVFSILSLFVSCILYLLFLWHHIPSEDGSLTAYCRRKINRRFERIVKEKVDKVLAKDVVLQDRGPSDPELGTGSIKRQPTLPAFHQPTSDNFPEMPPPLSRQTTVSTLPPYSNSSTRGPGPQRQPTLPSLRQDHSDGIPEMPGLSRQNTQYSSSMTPGPTSRRQPSLPDFSWSAYDDMAMDSNNHGSRVSDDNVPLVNNAAGFSFAHQCDDRGPPVLPPIERQGTPPSLMVGPRLHDRPSPLSDQEFSFPPPMPAIGGRASPVNRSQMSPPPPRTYSPLLTPASNRGYQGFPAPPGPRTPAPRTPIPQPPARGMTPGLPPVRNFTSPAISSPSNEYNNRSATPNSRPRPPRSGTAPPQHPSPYGEF